MGSIELYQGNALRVMRALPGELFDAVITDPPYSSGGRTMGERQKSPCEKYTAAKRRAPFDAFAGESMDQRAWTSFMVEALEVARSVCAPGAVCAVFVDWRQYPAASDALQRAGWTWRGAVVWDKLNARPQPGRFRQQAEFLLWGSNGRLPIDRPCPYLPGVYAQSNVAGTQRIHMTQKPVELMRSVVKICLTGGRILDPFAGSGSTLEAARLEGYDAVGIEIDGEIARKAAERLDVEIQTVEVNAG